MLIYESRSRTLKFKDDATVPAFPARAVISAMFLPPVPFGAAVGRTRNTVGGQSTRARVSPSTGHFFFEADEPLFPPLSVAAVIDAANFSVQGNEVSVEAPVSSIQELTDLLGALCYAFPGILNLYLPDSPYPLYAWGQVGGVPFQWHFTLPELNSSLTVTSHDAQGEHLIRSWRRVALVRRSPRVFMSLHYFRIACRLLLVGPNRFSFMAEAVLNLAKSLQALGGESRDEVRSTLTDLGVSTEDVETLYVPALILRSAFDVAHVSLTQYSTGELAVLHDYVDRAEVAFRNLLQTALDRYEAGTFSPRPHAADPGATGEKRFIATLGAKLAASKRGPHQVALRVDRTFKITDIDVE